MLHLVRTLNDEGIVIRSEDGRELKFTITKTWGKHIRLSFDKFDGFSVNRGEVDRKQKMGFPEPLKLKREA